MIVLYIILAILVFMLMITVHELGHYLAGKLFKFKINEFAIGFGKSLYSKTNKKTGEKFSLRLFPFGGYCAFQDEDAEATSEGSFNAQAPWKRLIVLFAGAFFNIIFGLLTVIIMLMAIGYDAQEIKTVAPINSQVIYAGDLITEVDGEYISLFKSLSSKIQNYDVGEKVELTIKRDGEKIKVLAEVSSEIRTLSGFGENLFKEGDIVLSINGMAVTAMDAFNLELSKHASGDEISVVVSRYDANLNKMVDVNVVATIDSELLTFFEDSAKTVNILGIGAGLYQYGFFESLGACFRVTWNIILETLAAFGKLITGKLALNQVSGPFGSIGAIASGSMQNIMVLLLLIPLISINLGVFNLLPIPALDGGRMVFVGIEWVRGKPVKREVEGMIHFVGLILLLSFVVFIDIIKLFI